MEIKGQQRSLDLPQFVRLAPENVVTDLGPLAGLAGTWTGKKGWNLIAVPKPDAKDSFTLLVRPFYETITFTPLGVLVPDRGASEILNIYGLEYTLKVSDLLTNQPLHLENGMWLYTNDPQDPQGPTIVRHATVPHGNSVLALGDSKQADGPPDIPVIDAFPVGNPFDPPLPGYTDPYLSPPPPKVPGQPPFSTKDPNEVLRAEIQGQNIVSTLTLSVSTQTGTGGIVNIPFIAQNANATAFSAAFWLETVQDQATGEQFSQLQYSQQTNLEFIKRGDGQGLITWPHVNVNTLVRQ